MENYLLDANVYIQAYRDYYGFDIAPGFWKCLKNHSDSRQIRSIDRIKDELKKGKDDLWTWANETYGAAFLSTDTPEVTAAFTKVMNWAQKQPQFTAAAKAEFASCADGWLVACAMVAGFTVVTFETFDAAIKRRVKIPNACRHFGVPITNTFTMLRNIGARLE